MNINKICLFTGAGISAPLGLPITSGFNSTIAKIDPDLKKFLDGYLKDSSNDIEKVLYALEDFVKADSLVSFIIRSSSNTNPYSQFTHYSDSLKLKALESIKLIKGDIYKLLKPKDLHKSFQLYSKILNEISSCYVDAAFSIFTTNYDCTFESGMFEYVEELEKTGIIDINYGFSGGKHGRASFNNNEDFNWNKTLIEYNKLHGSLDWTRDSKNNCVRSGTELDPADPAAMPLLYPGFKGTPTQEPFISIHERLYQRLNEVKIVFAIGFAFRDSYINNLFEFAIRTNKELKILCYNPAEKNNLPSDSSISYFTERYPQNFFHVKQSIEIKETPLELEIVLKKLNLEKT